MKTSDQNASSLGLYIGKTGVLRCEYLSVDVEIVDALATYGSRLQLGDESFRKAMDMQFFGSGLAY
jgi:hypothetical protein